MSNSLQKRRLPKPALRAAAATAAVCAAALAIWSAAAAQENHARDALWGVVHTLCVPNQLQHHDPKPCAEVNLKGGEARGYAILKDLRGASQFLLIPTARIAGTESPELLAPNAPNYFSDAWEARKYVGESLHRSLPREDISMAVNSASSRSQDQFHIHVDCVRVDVRAAVRLHNAQIGAQWTPFPVLLAGHRYQARWVAGEKLGDNDPFQLVASGIPGAMEKMGDHTVAAIAARRADGAAGFLILDDQVNKATGDMAHSEDLQDHDCRVAALSGAGSN